MEPVQRSPEPPPSPELDPLDLRILSALRGDVRRSVRSLAREMNVAPATVGARLHRMEQQGPIRGYLLELDPGALGLRLSALLGVRLVQGDPLDEVMDRLLASPWIDSVWAVTGNWDLVVLVHARDQEHLLAIIQDEVWTLPSFTHSESMVILRRCRRASGWLDAIAGGHGAP